jgi:integral membrane protein (TIGR01906 family)
MSAEGIEPQVGDVEEKVESAKWKAGIRAAGWLITIAIPVLLVLLSVRAMMTPLFLQLEYNRPGFPEDIYGFTREDRLYYAPFAVDYLLNDADIAYLGDLTFADGTPLFTSSELRHMEDVKVVTRAAFFVLLLGGIATLGVGYGLWRSRRDAFWQALFNGGALTIGLIVVIVLGAVVAWDFFFTTFHQLFFDDGTWIFLYSDTLIRLFPEQFWFDAALTIGGLTVGGTLLLLAISWRALRA